MERYGLDVMEGDLVVLAEGFDRPMSGGKGGGDARPAKAARAEGGAGGGKDAAPKVDVDDWANDPAVSTGGKYTIRTLTAEDAASGKYAMSDLVLPTPGWDVVYPGNDLGPKYAEWLSRDGVDLNQNTVKDFRLVRSLSFLSVCLY